MECSNHVSLLGKLDVLKLLSSSHHVLVLDSHDTTSPDSAELLVVVELSLEGLLHGIEIGLIFPSEISHSNASGSLEMDKLAEFGLTTGEAERYSLLSAKSGQEDNHFDWVDIVGNDDKLGFSFLNKSGNVVKTVLEVDWFGSLSRAILSFLLESLLFVLSGFWTVFCKQFKELGSCVLINGTGELVDGGRHLESLHQDSLLSLDSDVFGPFHETGQVSRWLDVSSKSEVAWLLFEERALT